MKRNYFLYILLGLVFMANTYVKHKPTVYIIGDSTVKTGKGNGVGGLWGWGDPIAQHFDTSKINVENHALGGTSSRTFQTKGLWETVLGKIEKGDFVLMQFGHNDGGAVNDSSRARGTIKGIGEETEEIDNILTGKHEIVHSYGWYLRKMIRETKAKGATPIIITPIPRNDWDNGKIKRTPGSYPDWAMEVARQENVQFVDLNKSMSDKLDTIGENQVTGKYFYSRDHTHTSAEGAILNASLVIEGIKTIPNCQLNRFLLKYTKSVFPKIQVIDKMVLANAYFMNKWPDPGQVIVTNKTRPSNIWTRAVYYEGLMALYNVNPDKTYYDYVVKWGEAHQWGLNGGIITRNADNHCCAQTYIDLYLIDKKPERIKDIKASIDLMMETTKIDDWTWIDALQMAMPVFAKLSALYNDNRYYERMYEMYMHSKTVQGVNGLFNPKDNLWWRDKDFVSPYKEPNGEDCYWSRGNGWVMAALVRVLAIMPKDAPHRKEYQETFEKMANALIPIQREDGFWNASLHDSKNFGGKELSGTALFTYGMAWGVNNGILSKRKYLPVIEKAWNAMVKESVHDTGFLGYVQATGKQPSDGQPLTYDRIPDFEDYGLGCFLLAGSEVSKLCK